MALQGSEDRSYHECPVPAGEVRRRTGGGRVLVVEDDQPLSRFLCRTLETELYDAELAHTVPAAL